jgi:hypothetical protein
MLDDLRILARLARDLPPFVRNPVTLEQARERVSRALQRRTEAFLDLVRTAVFANPGSPFRRLFEIARCTFGDVESLVAERGLEGALRELYAAGVHVGFEEFKGRRPLVRAGREIPLHPDDFANPNAAGHIRARSSGSRGGGGAPFLVDLAHLEGDAATHCLSMHAFGCADRPLAIWRPTPPGVAGFNNAMRQLKIGNRVERWFSQHPAYWRHGHGRDTLLMYFAVAVCRLSGKAFPLPRHVPLDAAAVVSEYLARRRSVGRPLVFDSTVSCAVRVCQAAREHGHDISGTVLRVGGEPLTPERARICAEAGARVVPQYSMAEVGRIGVACAAPEACDDVHLLGHKIACFTVDKAVGRTTVPALVYTTIAPTSPLILLNVETDDFAVLRERACGCPFGELGLNTHLHTIRSYDKLTSEGMTFFGVDLHRVIEEILPARFGGGPTDYQFIEIEEQGLPVVQVAVSPRVGTVSSGEVLETVYRALRQSPDGEMMADHWEEARTLRVVRREPCATRGAKTLALHVARAAGAATAPTGRNGGPPKV